MRIGIAGQEGLQPQEIGRAGTAEQNRADTPLQQTNAPQNEGAHDELAKLRGSHDERAQSLGVERQGDAPVRACERSRERRAVRQLMQLAGKLTALDSWKRDLLIQSVTSEKLSRSFE